VSDNSTDDEDVIHAHTDLPGRIGDIMEQVIRDDVDPFEQIAKMVEANGVEVVRDVLQMAEKRLQAWLSDGPHQDHNLAHREAARFAGDLLIGMMLAGWEVSE
jgi:hypothetical protein